MWQCKISNLVSFEVEQEERTLPVCVLITSFIQSDINVIILIFLARVDSLKYH